MSLINQMLRDLDQREEKLPSAEVIEIYPTGNDSEGNESKPWWIFVALLVVAVAAAGFYLWSSHQDAKSYSEQVTDERSSEAAVGDKRAIQGQPPIVPEPTTVSAGSIPVAQAISPVEKASKVEVDVVESAVGLVQMPPPAIVDESELGIFSLSLRDRKVERLADLSPTPKVERVIVVKPRSRVDTAPKATSEEPKQKAPTPAQSVVLKPLSPIERAERHMTLGYIVEARQVLQQILDSQPERTDARELLLSILQQQGDAQAFSDSLDTALVHSPDHLQFVLMQARRYLQRGEVDKAEALLVEKRGLYPEHVTLLSLLGATYQQAGSYQAALPVYRELLRLDSASARAWAGQGISLEAMGQNAEAVESYRHALRLQRLPQTLSSYVQQRLQLLVTE